MLEVPCKTPHYWGKYAVAWHYEDTPNERNPVEALGGGSQAFFDTAEEAVSYAERLSEIDEGDYMTDFSGDTHVLTRVIYVPYELVPTS